EMVWNDDAGVTRRIVNFYSKRNSVEEKKYNYPKAYLLYALAMYCRKNDPDRLVEVKEIFDSYIDDYGNPNFELNKLDQVVFGMTSLVLYETYKDERYLHFSQGLFNFVKQHMDENGIIAYRKGQKTILNDALGMIVPFLTMYSKVTNDTTSYRIAKKQIDQYIKFGVDEATYLPSHAYNLESKVQVGSSNWGRGIGWYYLSLSSIHDMDRSLYQTEIFGLSKTIGLLKNSEGLWSQYPGSSDRFDASTTTMLAYCEFLLNDNMSTETILPKILKYISDDGDVLDSSGDTYAVNEYSRTFGRSKLSQAFLILLLSF